MAKQVRAESLNVGDSFRLPSTNGHDTDGFRRYTVIERTETAIRVEDVHGYRDTLPFGSAAVAQFLKPAIPDGRYRGPYMGVVNGLPPGARLLED